ncbi:hypothetical protein CN645_02980 [Burkholderia sp. IDO3]|nr:hypothetical protein DCN14_08515 [Burkholderia sp. IDO3]PCD63362.1 hypothetical protein CN645_02980 [Burkholderia sp. IDO3]
MPGTSVIGTADGSPLIRPDELTQTPCHVGSNRAARPAAQGSPVDTGVAAMRRSGCIGMQRGTDVVRCSTVAVRHRGARRCGTMHADAASHAPRPRGCMRLCGRCSRRCGACRHARRVARASWPGYC